VHRAAADWLRANSTGKFFLWVHYFAPHRPFQPPARLARRFDAGYEGPIDGSIAQMNYLMENRIELAPEDLAYMISLYDGEILSVDRRVEHLLATVRELGLDRETLVVFTSDHGEELYERNHYFSHSASIYDTVLKAPLLFRWPGVIPEGRWRGGVVESIDIAPTILDLAGIEAPPQFEGQSLARWIRSGSEPSEPALAFSEIEDRVVSVRSRDYRFIHNPTGFAFPITSESPGAVYPFAAEELYLHRNDPLERSKSFATRCCSGKESTTGTRRAAATKPGKSRPRSRRHWRRSGTSSRTGVREPEAGNLARADGRRSGSHRESPPNSRSPPRANCSRSQRIRPGAKPARPDEYENRRGRSSRPCENRDPSLSARLRAHGRQSH
jgi:hypothetical protein